MRATFDTKPFLASLQTVARACAAGSTLPILSCVRICFTKDGAMLTCDNLDARVSSRVEGIAADKEFAFCVGVNLLRYALRGETAELTMEKRSLTVISGGRTTLGTLDVDEFPGDSTWGNVKLAPVDSEELSGALIATLPMVSTDHSRYTICGVHWEKSTSRMAATNGKGLSVKPVSMPLKNSATIPSSAAKLILACLGGVGDWEIGVDDSRICVSSGNVTVWAKLIDGTYPNFNAVIPEATPFATVDREALLSAMQSIAPFMEAQDYHRVLVTPGDTWKLSTRSKAGDESEVEIDAVVTSKAEPFAVNAAELAALLKPWTCDKITIGLNNSLLIQPESESGQIGVMITLRV